jgi:DNA-binding transcriptional LysR family regulator
LVKTITESMVMELRHIRYFLAVAEELHFRKAAERLHVTQPSLSAQIRDLEEEIGARLLDRDTHRVELTAAGRHFLDGSRRILAMVQELEASTGRIVRGEAGELRVGFVGSLGHGLLPAVLREFRKNFPLVELRLVEMDTTTQLAEIGARKLDIGFIGLGLASAVEGLKIEKVTEERLFAALPEQHPLAKKHRRSLPLAALAEEAFLMADRKSAPLFNPWLLVLCQRAGFQPRSIQEAGQPVTVLNYVAAGLGVTILPGQFARIPTVGVVFVSLGEEIPSYRYCAAWAPENEHPGLRRLLASAKKVAGSNKKRR